ncbi:MAG: YiiX/YebB-like N1pC/P60 family cysteine hydrolase [Azonexus sp.]
MRNIRLALAAATLLAAFSCVAAPAAESAPPAAFPLLTENVCGAERQTSYSQAAMERKIAAYQVLSEEVLSQRARAIDFLELLKARDARGEPLSGTSLKRLNQGAAALLNQRQALLTAVAAHECWLDNPVPADPAAARVQATGIALSLSAALMLYDNYLSVVGLYRANPFLRQHLNSRDSGFAIPRGELNRISISFNSAINRARTRRALDWYEQHGRQLPGSAIDGERYLAALIEQSPSYQMVRHAQPLGYVGNMLGFFSVFSLDTLNSLKNEGVNLSSLLFGNAAGLVETRRGKLDGQAPVLEKLATTARAGDVLLEKTPFRLTDAFIPGHWGHVAVWVGSETELRQLGIWEHPVVRPHQANIRAGRGVVEALRAGVKMNTLAHFLNIDDLALLRPKQLTDAERVEVVLQTLRQVGKAYDFNFDVESTDRIVCSELVYHAYGDVRWPTARHLGRVTISPDNVAIEAIGEGSFDIGLLYHDGQEVADERSRYMSSLVQPTMLKMARAKTGS